MAQQATYISYVIEDGTGTLEIKKWLDADAAMDSDYEATRRDEIIEGSYVRIFGQLRMFGTKKSVVAYHVRPITSVDEITFHNLEVLYVHRYLTQPASRMATGPGMSSGPGAPGLQAPGSTMYGGMPAARGNELEMAGFSPLQANLLQLIKQVDVAEGAFLADLTHRLRGSAGPEEVRETVEWLCAEGHVYTTIDDDHFKSTSD